MSYFEEAMRHVEEQFNRARSRNSNVSITHYDLDPDGGFGLEDYYYPEDDMGFEFEDEGDDDIERVPSSTNELLSALIRKVDSLTQDINRIKEVIEKKPEEARQFFGDELFTFEGERDEY